MDPRVAETVIVDGGHGKRLDAACRSDLRDELRAHAKAAAGCVLFTVQGDAWHQAPETANYDTEQLAQPSVEREFQSLTSRLFRLEVPVVVHLRGKVSGFGLALALAADIRVATPTTTFATGGPETASALLGGSTWLLERAMNHGTLAHLAWTGAELTASAAAAQYLVSDVTTDTSAGRQIAERLAVLPRSATSVTKRALTSRCRPDLEATLDYESWLPSVAIQRES